MTDEPAVAALTTAIHQHRLTRDWQLHPASKEAGAVLAALRADPAAARAVAAALDPEGYSALWLAAKLLPETQAMMRRLGFVLDKWPPKDIPVGGWTPEALAALDPETRWQGFAFSLYSDMARVSVRAQDARNPQP